MKFSASPEVDSLWHTHVLCTENYAAFMKCLHAINPFVDFIHHSLSGASHCESVKESRQEATKKAYAKLFGKTCEWMSSGYFEEKNGGPTMPIYVRTLTGKTLTIEISHLSTISLKQRIQNKEGI